MSIAHLPLCIRNYAAPNWSAWSEGTGTWSIAESSGALTKSIIAGITADIFEIIFCEASSGAYVGTASSTKDGAEKAEHDYAYKELL